jgi:hypothetical protein
MEPIVEEKNEEQHDFEEKLIMTATINLWTALQDRLKMKLNLLIGML